MHLLFGMLLLLTKTVLLIEIKLNYNILFRLNTRLD